jgi:hypothetical protein
MENILVVCLAVENQWIEALQDTPAFVDQPSLRISISVKQCEKNGLFNQGIISVFSTEFEHFFGNGRFLMANSIFKDPVHCR